MTARDTIQFLGKTLLIKSESWYVQMRCLDVKEAYGNIRLLVSPVNGHGEAWVDSGRVVFEVPEVGVSINREIRM